MFGLSVVRTVVGLVVFVSGAVAAGEVKELFAAFLEKPGKETYLAVLKAVTEVQSYDPYSLELDGAGDLIRAKKFKEAQEAIEKAMPNLLLSPRAHLYLAVAAEGLGEADKAKAERDAAAKCIQGILATGDGSAEKPYVVSRVSDEYDVLRHLKKMRQVQGLRHKDGKSFDVMQCADGSEVWFDITVVFGSMSKRLKGKQPAPPGRRTPS